MPLAALYFAEVLASVYLVRTYTTELGISLVAQQLRVCTRYAAELRVQTSAVEISFTVSFTPVSR